MLNTKQVHYFYDTTAGVELVFCQNSMISYPPHTHVSRFTAGLVLDGSIMLFTGNDSRVLEAGEGFLVPPHTLHKIEACAPYSLLSFCIHRGLLFQQAQAEKHLRLLLDEAPQLDAFLVLSLFRRLEAVHDLRPLPPPIALAVEQLERFPEAELPVGEMARSVYISKYHFIRNFQHAVGLTPHQFQIQNRVRKAQRILVSSESVAEAALAAGFYDQSHFTRHFKRLVGLTPTVYRASCTALSLDL